MRAVVCSEWCVCSVKYMHAVIKYVYFKSYCDEMDCKSSLQEKNCKSTRRDGLQVNLNYNFKIHAPHIILSSMKESQPRDTTNGLQVSLITTCQPKRRKVNLESVNI